MKTLRITITAITAILLAGALFFSCELANPDPYGTLVITLPGSGSARSLSAANEFSEDFLATLRYIVECTGPGTKSEEFGPNDGKATISLSTGDWLVTLKVVNAAKEEIGREQQEVTIEAGKTTLIKNIKITVGKSNEITKFTVTNLEADVTRNGDDTIVVTVPPATDITKIQFSVEHNGFKTSHENDNILDFSDNNLYTFSVQPEYGKTRTYTVSVVVEEKPVPGGVWPTPAEWAEYNLTNGLTQPRPEQTMVAYVIDGWDSFNLSAQAREDLNSLPGDISSSINDRDFLMVKLGFNNAEKAAKDGIYIGDTTSLFKQIQDENKFPKVDNIDWNSSSPERWDIFKKSNTAVNLYMNYAGNYIIILAVKEHSWGKIRWEEYGLASLEQPAGAKVVYVSYDKDESNKTNSKLQTDYGMRVYENKTFPYFFAVVFLDENGNIFEQLKKIEPFNSATKDDITNNDKENYITIVNRLNNSTYTRAIDLYKSKAPAYKNYTIITVRQGDKTSSDSKAYW